MRWVSGVVGFGLVAPLAACGAPDGSASYDCSSQVRYDGRVYIGLGYTDSRARRLAEADVAQCGDVGGDPEGSVFPDDPRQVTVWRLGDHPADQVVGVRHQDSFAVFVADSVPREEAERVLRELGAD